MGLLVLWRYLTITMSGFEPFCGKWQQISCDNFDEFMKTLGMNIILRKAANAATTYLDVSKEEDNCRWQFKIAFKSGDLKFKLGEEFDEVTADGRPVKSNVKVEDGKLVWHQTGKPHNTLCTRYLEDDGQTMIEEAVALADKNVVSIRKYKRI